MSFHKDHGVAHLDLRNPDVVTRESGSHAPLRTRRCLAPDPHESVTGKLSLPTQHKKNVGGRSGLDFSMTCRDVGMVNHFAQYPRLELFTFAYL